MSDSDLFGSQDNLQAEGFLEQRAVLFESQLFERQVVCVRDKDHQPVVLAFAGQVGDALRVRTVERDSDSQQRGELADGDAAIAIERGITGMCRLGRGSGYCALPTSGVPMMPPVTWKRG